MSVSLSGCSSIFVDRSHENQGTTTDSSVVGEPDDASKSYNHPSQEMVDEHIERSGMWIDEHIEKSSKWIENYIDTKCDNGENETN